MDKEVTKTEAQSICGSVGMTLPLITNSFGETDIFAIRNRLKIKNSNNEIKMWIRNVPDNVPKPLEPTKSETRQTWIKNFFYEGPIKWYILLDDITMKKSKFSPDETRLFINGQENFQTQNEQPIVVDVIVHDL